MSQLTKNTADLDALIAKANALPDAGSGGGSVTPDALCNVSVKFSYYKMGATPRYDPNVKMIAHQNQTGGSQLVTYTMVSSSSAPSDVIYNFTAPVGSMVVLCAAYEPSTEGSTATLGGSGSVDAYDMYAYTLSGDVTFTVAV